jgi:hypothetical protein
MTDKKTEGWRLVNCSWLMAAGGCPQTVQDFALLFVKRF